MVWCQGQGDFEMIKLQSQDLGKDLSPGTSTASEEQPEKQEAEAL